MLELKPLVPKPDRVVLRTPQQQAAYDPKQRRLMVIALAMLLVTLGFVLYSNRDFWFPDEQDQEADSEQPAAAVPTANLPTTSSAASSPKASSPASKGKRRSTNTKPEAPAQAPAADSTAADAAAAAGATATTSRTVLPPLEVEVIAGDTHSTVRPGSNSVRVDLQPNTPPTAAPDAAATVGTQTPANVTSNAAERVQMSADTAQVVSRPVSPGYPLLARQMKVQGSVILQALIGKDGIIQNLRVVSGPTILASAAEAAVRQWHFKPHLVNNEAVETEAKITVNFTITAN